MVSRCGSIMKVHRVETGKGCARVDTRNYSRACCKSMCDLGDNRPVAGAHKKTEIRDNASSESHETSLALDLPPNIKILE